MKPPLQKINAVLFHTAFREIFEKPLTDGLDRGIIKIERARL